jgi:soluble lytic murein transglycosylase-like protein
VHTQRQESAPTVAPSIVPKQQVTTVSGNVGSWLAASQWPSQYHAVVARIIQCESSGNPGAVSSAGYVGLMQIAPWFHGSVPSDPVAQLNQAYEVYLKQGWGAWGCY